MNDSAGAWILLAAAVVVVLWIMSAEFPQCAHFADCPGMVGGHE